MKNTLVRKLVPHIKNTADIELDIISIIFCTTKDLTLINKPLHYASLSKGNTSVSYVKPRKKNSIPK